MNNTQHEPTKQNTIAILQYNLNRNRTTTESVLNHPDTKRYAILMLQEQFWWEHKESSLTHQSWTLIEPPRTTSSHPRTAIYINNSILPTTSYEQIYIPHSDVTAVAIKTKDQRKPALLINIYNAGGNNLTNNLERQLNDIMNTQKYGATIFAGDFNLHHPLWNPEGYRKQDTKAEELIAFMANHGMKLISPPGTITFPRTGTAIDLVWGNNQTEQGIIKCRIAKYDDHGSDHLPWEIILNLQPHTTGEELKQYNLEKTDWKVLEHKIEQYLPNINEFNPENASPQDIDQLANNISTAISRALQETTPRKRMSPFSKRWWKPELTGMRRIKNKARNIFRRTRREEDKIEWKEKLREYNRAIKRAKRETWRNFVEQADEKTIWQVKKYTDSTPTTTYIPTLQGKASTNEEKATTFQKTFFPPPISGQR